MSQEVENTRNYLVLQATSGVRAMQIESLSVTIDDSVNRVVCGFLKANEADSREDASGSRPMWIPPTQVMPPPPPPPPPPAPPPPPTPPPPRIISDAPIMASSTLPSYPSGTLTALPIPMSTVDIRPDCGQGHAAAPVRNTDIAAMLRRKLKKDDAHGTKSLDRITFMRLQLSGRQPHRDAFCDGVPRVLFLGTGCAAPSKHRNASCILLQLPLDLPPSRGDYSSSAAAVHDTDSSSFIMLDAGEGCLAQLFLFCGGDYMNIQYVLQRLRFIWISHHHADHHCGLAALLEEILRQSKGRESSSIRKLQVMASGAVIRYHEFLACVGGYDHLVEFIPIESSVRGPIRMSYHTSGVPSLTLHSIPVWHCRESYGVVIHTHNDYKIVYSGDCRPSKDLIAAGRMCNLLIHEATFDDSREGDAVRKKHCTASEAVEVAIQMQARHVVLTHFSQRYPQIDSCHFSSHSHSGNLPVITLAHDFLSVNL